jgi:hypothetical protein
MVVGSTEGDATMRQGDVLLVPIDRAASTDGLVRQSPENGHVILARGEHSGHHHSLPANSGAVFFMDTGLGGGGYLEVPTATVLEQLGRSNEWVPGMHTPLDVPAGTYEVRVQRGVRANSLRSRRVGD